MHPQVPRRVRRVQHRDRPGGGGVVQVPAREQDDPRPPGRLDRHRRQAVVRRRAPGDVLQDDRGPGPGPLVGAGPQREFQRVPEEVLGAVIQAEQGRQVQPGALHGGGRGELQPVRRRQVRRRRDRGGSPRGGQARADLEAGDAAAEGFLGGRGAPRRQRRVGRPPVDLERPGRVVAVALQQQRRVARRGVQDVPGAALVEDAVPQVGGAEVRGLHRQRRRGRVPGVLGDEGVAVGLQAVDVPVEGQVAVEIAVRRPVRAVAPAHAVPDGVGPGGAPVGVRRPAEAQDPRARVGVGDAVLDRAVRAVNIQVEPVTVRRRPGGVRVGDAAGDGDRVRGVAPDPHRAGGVVVVRPVGVRDTPADRGGLHVAQDDPRP